MAELLLTKLPNGTLAAADQDTQDAISKLRLGQAMHGKFSRVRNYKFLQKFMTLVRYAFDVWTDTVPARTYRGQAVQPSIDKFREDITILAGYSEAVFGISGDLRLKAKSISFANMGEDEFEGVYSAVISVILERVLSHTRMTEAELREVVERILAYDR
jgi:hypothetical protein